MIILVTLQRIVSNCSLHLLPITLLIWNAKWLLYSAASYNFTSDLANLSIHSDHDGQDEVILKDGTCLHVANIGSPTVSSPSHSLILKETLHVPLIHKNLISVYKFTHDNNVVVEFHPFFYSCAPCEISDNGSNAHAQ